ncbi:ABC transporter ATP-binding protein [Aeromicrobium sp. 9AM]|uniref:ABC transporter ATP-binding protein n=1 Tax=Aeromicrobium sp. 9AM TaxID=2653126 RepID=UPI0012F2B696|nr:ABC transporter ATP-binding protein [Aeromicrobium sp. 9AM]VXB62359.1 Spermidine/putrescine import ATP-binding protein PotA [Aeromicrobium sp. 9AM]
MSINTSNNASAHPALEVRDVCKSYGGNLVVDQVNLTVKHGEFLTLLGPSGSGKTTTLRMVAGFLDCDEGRITIDGRDVTDVPAHKRDAGMVFQHYALFPHLTAVQNVAFPLRMRGVPRAKARQQAQQMLERMHLGGKESQTPAQLSGGQQQRVALARALVFEPRLLLMDEPLGALDKKLRDALQIEIVNICHEIGVTVVYVTHDQEEALAMSDRIAIYKDGKIEQIGSGEDLYDRPASVFVSEFIGSSNIMHGRYDAAGGVLHGGAGPIKVVQAVAAACAPAPTDRAALVVRPERVTVQDATGAVPAGHSVVRGVLEESIFLGPVHRYLVRLPDGTLLQARVAARERADVHVGDEVVATWSDEQAVLLRSDHVSLPTEPEHDLVGMPR